MNGLNIDYLDIGLAVTGLFLLGTGAYWIVRAWWISAKNPDRSISVQIATLAKDYPIRLVLLFSILSYVLGLLCGHWFWPVHL